MLKNCKCKCRLDVSVCNNKQRWNNDKCRCECKELIDKVMCGEGFILSPSNCECECDKSYDVGEYLDYKKCRCREKLIDKLIEECSENIDKNEMIYNNTLNDYKHVCGSCTMYIVFIVCTPSFLLGERLNLLPNFKKGGLDRTLVFRGGWFERRG